MSLPSGHAIPDSIEPFIDNLWYYHSVISATSWPRSTPYQESPTGTPHSLPLSTGGQGSTHGPYPGSEGLESHPLCDNAATVAHHEDPPQLQELHRVFDLIDENHDGKLSEEELNHWMNRLGLQYTEGGMIQMITGADCDGKGSLDFTEFVSLNKVTEEATRGSSEVEWETLKEVFQLFDRDDNGLISAQELCLTLGKLGLLKKANDADYRRMIDRVDTDGDGEVSFPEFRRMMMHQNPIKSCGVPLQPM